MNIKMMIGRVSAILISVSLGLVFIYSGYTKLLPIVETFEFTFVEAGIANWYTAPVIARLLISTEFFIGLLLIINYGLRRFTLPFAIGLLSFFIIYLTYQIYTVGNKGNCACFGEHIKMTPLQAIIKNFIMIAAAIVVYVLFDGWRIRLNKVFLSLIGLTTAVLVFVVNPIDYKYTSNNLDEKVNYPLELELLYEPEDTTKVDVPSIELRKGKHVVAFLSLSCSHCKIAAKKFRLIKKSNPDLPIYFVLNGDKDKYAAFIEDTGANNIPYSFCLGKSFVQLSSARLPRIYYLDNGLVVKKVDYFELNQYDIEDWLEN